MLYSLKIQETNAREYKQFILLWQTSMMRSFNFPMILRYSTILTTTLNLSLNIFFLILEKLLIYKDWNLYRKPRISGSVGAYQSMSVLQTTAKISSICQIKLSSGQPSGTCRHNISSSTLYANNWIIDYPVIPVSTASDGNNTLKFTR